LRPRIVFAEKSFVSKAEMNYQMNAGNRSRAALRQRASVAAWAIPSAALFVGIALAQTPKAAPTFDVVSIRSADLPTPETMRSRQFRAGTTINEGIADFEFVSLADLLPHAYRVKSFQVVGPQSLRESRWNIRARLPQGGSRDQIPDMVQAMLVDRFKLEIHREKRDLPVYELVVLKGGLKLKPSEVFDTADDTIATLGPPGLFPFGVLLVADLLTVVEPAMARLLPMAEEDEERW
jgi:hypothetical protein